MARMTTIVVSHSQSTPKQVSEHCSTVLGSCVGDVRRRGYQEDCVQAVVQCVKLFLIVYIFEFLVFLCFFLFLFFSFSSFLLYVGLMYLNSAFSVLTPYGVS